MFEGAEVVKEGTWIYDDCIVCNMRIIKWHTLYGSGDYEDPPEIQDDREIECYYVEYESMTENGKYGGGRGFLTLSEAMEDAEKSVFQKINWK